MTQLLEENYSEVSTPDWSYDTLKPPKLNLRNMARDLKWHLWLYKKASLPYKIVVMFVVLRILQRVAYNIGWRKGGIKNG